MIITLIIVLLMGVLSQGQNGILQDGLNLAALGFFNITASARSTPDSATPDEVRRLEKENAELRGQLVDYYDIVKENERLLRYFEISKKNPGYILKPSSVISRNPDDDFCSFVINTGYADGVSAGDPVITENGLVGQVSGTGYMTSTVKTALSPELKISACDKRTGDSGVLSGSAELSEKNQSALTLLGENCKIKKGDIIVTLGGDSYPPNLIIGSAGAVEYDNFDSSPYAAVGLYEEIKSLESVAVITDFPGKTEGDRLEN